MTGGKKTLTVVAALIRRNGAFLICRRPEGKALSGLWEFPGGKVEQGETEEEALRREIREELDCLVAPEKLFCRARHEYPDFFVELSFYLCRLDKGEPRLLEHADAKWIRPMDVKNYAFCPADEGVLQKITREL